ncbi:diaminopimelate decarboxylase [archaeon]|jgi:diaminopimelate decarboxylase|nr:diaminopimelate decarboxylase [archaeon]MBT3730893.1 diaminopimelate decarboxylase [archaeon]MBT4669868.1 diaminopimelate decarboxylase [archaeon]MBT5030020.1 diaminopimelate decarboxylase [archaeon]MBT5288121.1 diaminopimelate decarboxylase [archaeon]
MQLKIGNISAIELAKTYGTPLYVYDKSILLNKMKELKDSFPNSKICYAIKANSNLDILKIIANGGFGADCSNAIELSYAKKAGFNLKNSLFTAVNPKDEDLKFALESGVTINLDDISILKRLLNFGTPEIISFRINPGFGKGKFPGIVVGGSGTKFGMNEDLAREAYKLAKQKGIKRFGIHMMTGSCVLYEDYFEELTFAIQEIANRISQSLDINFEFIDIGGGLGVPYEPHEKALNLKSIGERVEKAFTYPATLFLEPGRFFVAESGTLLTQVTTIKNNFIGVDAGMSTLLRPALYNAYHPIVLANNTESEYIQEANIVGPICENTDCFAKNRAMPLVKEKDILAIQVVGAYGFVMSSRYNGLLRPAEILVDNEKIEVIREREKIDDVI